MHVEYSARTLADVRRLADFLVETNPEAAAGPGGLRDLVISRRRSGCVALYQVDIVREGILILAIRHQRERGFLLQATG